MSKRRPQRPRTRVMRSFVVSLAAIVVPLTAARPASVAADAITAHAIEIATIGFPAT